MTRRVTAGALAALVGIASLPVSDSGLAACGGAFPDTTDAPPLGPPVAERTDLTIASAAGLRALEFATNFQRRSANLIGQNPLIVASAAADDTTGGSASADAAPTDSRLNVITTAIGGVGEENVSALGSTVDWDTAAASVGADYRLSPRWSVGAMLARSAVTGCSEPDDDFAVTGSVNVRSNEVDGDFDLLSVYSYFEADGYFVDGIVSAGSGNFGFTRRQTVNGVQSSTGRLISERVDETVVATTDGSLARLSVAAGLKRRLGPLNVSPFARLAWADVRVDRYRETLDLARSPDHPAPDAGGGFALRVSEQSVNSVTSGLGVNASLVKGTARAVLTLQSDIEWIHEYDDEVGRLSNAYAGFSQGTVYALALSQRLPDRRLDADYFLFGLGTSATFPRGVQLYAAGQFLLGYADVDETALSAGLRFEF